MRTVGIELGMELSSSLNVLSVVRVADVRLTGPPSLLSWQQDRRRQSRLTNVRYLFNILILTCLH